MKDVYDTITQQIIADLEQGVRPWIKPWRASGGQDRISLPLRATGEPYRGINILMLWCKAVAQGYVSPHWMTFKQAQALGAHVRKGEQATSIVYAGSITRTVSDDAGGQDLERHLPFLKSYAVFNADQIEGLPEPFMHRSAEPRSAADRIAHAEAFAAATGADIRHGGTDAYYRASTDHVQMPPFDSFVTAESYYATLNHELVHWSGHKCRLDRDFGGKRWGDEAYAAEELVAELGAAFVCAQLAITPELPKDHAAYIASWLKVLRTDKRAIFTAAAHAQRAVDCLVASTTSLPRTA